MCLVGWWLPSYLGARALVVGVLGRFVVGVPLVNVPWSLCLGGWLLVGRFVVGVPLVNAP